jgi:hypothetical protein
VGYWVRVRENEIDRYDQKHTEEKVSLYPFTETATVAARRALLFFLSHPSPLFHTLQTIAKTIQKKFHLPTLRIAHKSQKFPFS